MWNSGRDEDRLTGHERGGHTVAGGSQLHGALVDDRVLRPGMGVPSAARMVTEHHVLDVERRRLPDRDYRDGRIGRALAQIGALDVTLGRRGARDPGQCRRHENYCRTGGQPESTFHTGHLAEAAVGRGSAAPESEIGTGTNGTVR